MEYKSIREELEEFVATGQLIRLTREFHSRPHFGSIVAIGDEWLLLRQFIEFWPNGFTTLRVKDIDWVYSSDVERFVERILTSEGRLNREIPKFNVDLNDTRSLLKSLSEANSNIVIECKYPEREHADECDVGRVAEFTADRVLFSHFDGTGTWSKAPAYLQIDCISRIEFDTAYVNTVSKYVSEPPHFVR